MKLILVTTRIFLSRIVDNYGICCVFNGSTECFAPRSPFDTCKSMIPNNVLRVTLWVVCLFSVVANMVVIAGRIKNEIPSMRKIFSSTVGDKQNTFLLNLAVADFLMGVYLLAIGIADAFFGKDYFLYASSWRKGIMCKGIGFIGFAANIASILILTFVSIERFFVLVFPFGKYHFRSKLTVIICVTIWVISGMMALTPIILSEFFDEIFGFSNICLGLPFAAVPKNSRYEVAVEYDYVNFDVSTIQETLDLQGLQWLYSKIIYIYFSATCVSVITLCYIAIFISSIVTKVKSGRRGNNKDEIKMALRISIIVGTDLLCWLPVIIAGILSGIVDNIPSETYVWFAIFVMPINSAFNPFVYTFPTLKKRKKNEPSFQAEQRER
ncbi:hypothetical protein HOLleu_09497 [Holothuria leucospilota]|uniref:G-protein coupled receptors family 1 profile domain-containing protein n=1 Tax=Holothuria leucospilota TaxID=206669 RepID=A0A9Q1CCB9_HOLLE|nr:hypothetical protein HOLleu_09497 [Holothuria leucospilota]